MDEKYYFKANFKASYIGNLNSKIIELKKEIYNIVFEKITIKDIKKVDAYNNTDPEAFKFSVLSNVCIQRNNDEELYKQNIHDVVLTQLVLEDSVQFEGKSYGELSGIFYGTILKIENESINDEFTSNTIDLFDISGSQGNSTINNKKQNIISTTKNSSKPIFKTIDSNSNNYKSTYNSTSTSRKRPRYLLLLLLLIAIIFYFYNSYSDDYQKDTDIFNKNENISQNKTHDNQKTNDFKIDSTQLKNKNHDSEKFQNKDYGSNVSNKNKESYFQKQKNKSSNTGTIFWIFILIVIYLILISIYEAIARILTYIFGFLMLFIFFNSLNFSKPNISNNPFFNFQDEDMMCFSEDKLMYSSSKKPFSEIVFINDSIQQFTKPENMDYFNTFLDANGQKNEVFINENEILVKNKNSEKKYYSTHHSFENELVSGDKSEFIGQIIKYQFEGSYNLVKVLVDNIDVAKSSETLKITMNDHNFIGYPRVGPTGIEIETSNNKNINLYYVSGHWKEKYLILRSEEGFIFKMEFNTSLDQLTQYVKVTQNNKIRFFEKKRV